MDDLTKTVALYLKKCIYTPFIQQPFRHRFMRKENYILRHHRKDKNDTSKPSALFPDGSAPPWYLTVAVPASVVTNAHSLEAKTHVVGIIARACAVMCVDEICIYDDLSTYTSHKNPDKYSINRRATEAAEFIELVLSYLECPPFFRRELFPLNPALKFAALLPSIDLPHHYREEHTRSLTEAIVLEDVPGVHGGNQTIQARAVPVNLGQGPAHPLFVANLPGGRPLWKGERITIELRRPYDASIQDLRLLTHHTEPIGRVVDLAYPRRVKGLYWGFKVTRASGGLSSVLHPPALLRSPYDLIIGTSERGTPIDEAQLPPSHAHYHALRANKILVCFGGQEGLETAIERDGRCEAVWGATRGAPEGAFDLWVNFRMGQGSRTIRMEEALWLGLPAVDGWLKRRLV